MKTSLILALLACSVSLSTGLSARADVDLDREMLKPVLPSMDASESLNRTAAPSLLQPPVDPPVDLTPAFPEVADQSRLGGCQSFAMAAWLDYIFYFKTGHIVDFSEKALAYNLLNFMTDEFWDAAAQKYDDTYLGQSILPAHPYLGSGIAPLMLSSYFKYQVVPNSIYAFGNLNPSEGTVGLDFDLFNQFFEQNSPAHVKDEDITALPQAFFGAPPQRFIFKISSTNFVDGTPETLTFNTPQDLGSLIGLNANNVITYYNQDYTGFEDQVAPSDAKTIMNYFSNVSQHFAQRNQVVAKDALLASLKQSLERRMAVMIAADVWIGDWGTGVIFKGGGGHAMVVVGYQERDGKTYFKLRNSWGKDRLVAGYEYVEANTLMLNTLYIVVHEP